MSPWLTLAMRPLVSSSVLYVDLLVSTSTTTTPPSSAGMLSVATRTSLPRPQAWVTEAILSTTTVLIYFPPARAWNMPVSETILEKPSASCGDHSPWDSPYTPLETAINECGDSTPSTNKLPGRNKTWTLPVTRSCDDRNNASMSRHTGSSNWPSCTQSPYGPASDSLMRCWRGVSTSFSSSRCAVRSVSAAGASNATRPLVPMMVSPRWMPRPMPNGAPSVSSCSTTSTADSGLPSMPVGRPFSKWIVCFSGARGL